VRSVLSQRLIQAYISGYHSTSVLALLDPEDGGITVLRDVCTVYQLTMRTVSETLNFHQHFYEGIIPHQKSLFHTCNRKSIPRMASLQSVANTGSSDTLQFGRVLAQ
jgi:hypothetical protein